MATEPDKVYCPECGAGPGEPCTTKFNSKPRHSFHSVRQVVANNTPEPEPQPTSLTYDLVHCDVEEQHVMHPWRFQADEAAYDVMCDGSYMAPVPTSDLNIPSGPYAIGSDHWSGIAKLIEECAEVSQICAKLIATNGDSQHWDGKGDLYGRLSDELGDLTAAMIFVQQQNPQVAATQERVSMKLRWFARWHAEGRG